jgi:hypothetical protein
LAKKLLCYYNVRTRKIPVGGEKLKNFDQWTEELLKDAFLQAAKDDREVLLNADEASADDDFEEE